MKLLLLVALASVLLHYVHKRRNLRKSETAVVLRVESPGPGRLRLIKTAEVPPLSDFKVDIQSGCIGRCQIKKKAVWQGRGGKINVSKAYLNIKKRLRDQVQGRALALMQDGRLIAVYLDGNYYPGNPPNGRYKLFFCDARGLKVA